MPEAFGRKLWRSESARRCLRGLWDQGGRQPADALVPGIQASHTIVKRGWLGEPLQGSIQVNVHTAWENWPWLTQMPTLEVMYHSIHYLDAIRYVTGLRPEAVYADGARFPGQPYRGGNPYADSYPVPGEARGLIHDNHNNRMPQEDWYATFRFEGTEGAIRGRTVRCTTIPQGVRIRSASTAGTWSRTACTYPIWKEDGSRTRSWARWGS
ncbi:hypothetical protein LJK88_17430 [Paenibacillus sp. P26]|nr:hypothetical protein LJK88_17430 [Paenibacillus sp. P26]